MNGMNFKPFITKVLDSLSDTDLGNLYELMNKHSDAFTHRSLIDANNLLTNEDKGVGLFTIQLDEETIRTGYLLFNDDYCVLLGYVSNSERVVEYLIANNNFKVVKEYLTTDFLRHEVSIRFIEEGGGGASAGLVFNNIQIGPGASAVADWQSSVIYSYYGYIYECVIPCEGITADSVVEVVFDAESAVSGDYAPICESGNGTVTIYSKVDSDIVIPVIKEII